MKLLTPYYICGKIKTLFILLKGSKNIMSKDLKISLATYDLAYKKEYKNLAYFGHAEAFKNIIRYGEKINYKGAPFRFSMSPEFSNLRIYLGSPSDNITFFNNQYKIIEFDWETTAIPNIFKNNLMRCDEIWVHSDFVKNAIINSGLDASNIHVYHHGVHPNLSDPVLRGKNKKIRFLQIDAGSFRKNSHLTLAAFNSLFKDNDSYELTLKYSASPYLDDINVDTIVNWKNTEILENHGNWVQSNVREIRENLSKEDLYELIRFHDILVYPSSGEGFGLIPLEAIATGMPVITTQEWCSYLNYIDGSGRIYSEFSDISNSTDTIKTHFSYYFQDNESGGKVLNPSLESIINCMKNVSDDIENQSRLYYDKASEVIEKFSWDKVVFDRIDGLTKRAYQHML